MDIFIASFEWILQHCEWNQAPVSETFIAEMLDALTPYRVIEKLLNSHGPSR